MAGRDKSGKFKIKGNTYYEKDGYIVGITSKGEEFYIDKEDYESVSKHAWYIENNGYVRACIKDKNVQLHRFILNTEPTRDIDHRDHNQRNCRRENLRICSTSQNMMNMCKTSKKTSSKYKGVSYKTSEKRIKRWGAAVRCKGKLFSLGYHSTEEEAAIAYNKKAQEVFGEFAYLNVIGGDSYR